jgi:hypothetical protein
MYLPICLVSYHDDWYIPNAIQYHSNVCFETLPFHRFRWCKIIFAIKWKFVISKQFTLR